MSIPRIDGAAEWAGLPADVQASIGAAAIEMVAAWVGLDADNSIDGRATPETRAFETADRHCYDLLVEMVAEAIPAIDPDDPPLPSVIGAFCRGCGCTEGAACSPPCHWVEPDLCSACSDQLEPLEAIAS